MVLELGQAANQCTEVHLVEAGLAIHLTGHSPQRLTHDTTLLGNLLGTFVVMELRKQLTWSSVRARIFHFRTLAGKEVDIVLEDARGRLVGIEVKSAANVTKKYLSGLEILAEETGKKLYAASYCIAAIRRWRLATGSSLYRLVRCGG